MNNRGNKIGNYIAVAIILVCALVFIIYFLNTNNNNKKGQPLTSTTTMEVVSSDVDDDVETTTTQVIIDNNNNNTENNNTIVLDEVSNFDSSLYTIVSSLPLYGDYDVTTYYHGVEFDFKCTNYDVVSNKCLEGSALMKENNVLYPLYTYTNENDNYFTRGDDFYIHFSDDLVVLVNNYVGVYSGEARLFDRKGNTLGSLTNVITGYELNGNVYKKIYPNIEEGRIYYYTCNNGSVNISSSPLDNLSSVQIEEAVSGTCK